MTERNVGWETPYFVQLQSESFLFACAGSPEISTSVGREQVSGLSATDQLGVTKRNCIYIGGKTARNMSGEEKTKDTKVMSRKTELRAGG